VAEDRNPRGMKYMIESTLQVSLPVAIQTSTQSNHQQIMLMVFMAKKLEFSSREQYDEGMRDGRIRHVGHCPSSWCRGQVQMLGWGGQGRTWKGQGLEAPKGLNV
jgi:hypothetical protein